MPKITARGPEQTIVVKTKSKSSKPLQGFKWWNSNSKKDLANQLISTGTFLKDQQQYRYREAGINARLYGNAPLFSAVGSNLSRITPAQNLPIDRPTMNVVQSCVDTLVSRITQSRPRPIFLTDNGDYKERNLAKQLNSFILGELYRARAYELGPRILTDAAVFGTGAIKIFENQDKKVDLERTLSVELLVDPNDAFYGCPRQLLQIKLVDREVLAELFPKYRSDIEKAEQAFPDNSSESAKTLSDQVILVEGWRLPSGKDTQDGLHAIACSSGIIFEEEWKKDCFPFVFLPYCSRLTGFWGQPLTEQLMGTQVEINKLLITASKAINLVGVPRVFVEKGSKVVKAHLNSNIGAIVEYSGTKPIYEVAPCLPAEVYEQLQRLIQYAYQQSGISTLAASAQKPAGLNSGEAIRNYDDLQSDRFADLARRYDNLFVDLAYQITDKAKEIVERDGKYTTVYPNKNGTKEINFPDVKLLEDTYVIQCFDASSLPRDPAGRLEKVTEMAQSGMITMPEARRLLDYPDLEQVDKLANAPEERILKILDEIVENGKFTPPDPFMDLMLATQLVVQYYNLYVPAKLEESRSQLLRDFFDQIQALKMEGSAPASPMGMPPGEPQAIPQPRPTSDILPNAPQAMAGP